MSPNPDGDLPAGADLQVFFAEQITVAEREVAVAGPGQECCELSCLGAVRVFHALIVGGELDRE